MPLILFREPVFLALSPLFACDIDALEAAPREVILCEFHAFGPCLLCN